MCLILVALDSKPSLEIVRKAYKDNDDGVGIAWIKNGKACYEKGLFLAELEAKLDSLELPFALHFRASSIGGKGIFLTHPFEISEHSPLNLKGENNDSVLMHNGTYKDWDIALAAAGIEIPESDKMPVSDSRAFAMILSKLNNDQQKKFLDKINQKFVIIDGPLNKFRIFGDFTFENGMWFSNLKWKPISLNPLKPYIIEGNNRNHNGNNHTNYTVYDYKKSHNLNNETSILQCFVSPILSLLTTKDDKKKYFSYLKRQDMLNGKRNIKFIENPNINVISNMIVCRFCSVDIPLGRVQSLKMLGYVNHEMSCLECANKLNYFKYNKSQQNELPNQFGDEFTRLEKEYDIGCC